jgi:hypothetical protein
MGSVKHSSPKSLIMSSNKLESLAVSQSGGVSADTEMRRTAYRMLEDVGAQENDTSVASITLSNEVSVPNLA